MKVMANIFGWIGLFIIMGGAITIIAALLPLIPIALLGLLFFLPAAFYTEGEKKDNERE